MSEGRGCTNLEQHEYTLERRCYISREGNTYEEVQGQNKEHGPSMGQTKLIRAEGHSLQDSENKAMAWPSGECKNYTPEVVMAII